MLFDINEEKNKRRKKPKKLVGLEFDEVSLVDSPCNMIPFAIVKRDDKSTKEREKRYKDAKQEVSKVESAEIVINTDFTPDGTEVSINDNKLDMTKLDNFSFSYWKPLESDPPEFKPFNFGYTTIDEANGGQEVTSYNFAKRSKENMNTELKKATKALFNEEIELGEGLTDEEQVELAKHLNTINDYSSDFPTDLRKAIGFALLTKSPENFASKVANILRDTAEKIGELSEEDEETEEEEESEEEEEEEETDEPDDEEQEEEEEETEETDDEADEEETEEDDEEDEDIEEEDEEEDLSDDEIDELVSEASEDILDELLGE